MMCDARETTGISGGEQPIAQRGIPPERSSPLSDATDTTDTTGCELSVYTLVGQCQREIQAYHRGDSSDETYGLELLHRAIVQGDQAAWAGVQQCLGEIVRGWLCCHPTREAACRWESEENYVALAFERFWQARAQQRVVFKTFAGALVYLRASLNGAILDTLRAYLQPREAPMPLPEELGEPQVEDHCDSSTEWEILQTILPNSREQRLAYLHYHCGLKPREIVRFYPQEWSDVQEIHRLRRNILERVQRSADQLR